MSQNLSDFISAIAYKKLSAVETDRRVSNQHEFNGVTKLKNILGTPKKPYYFPARVIYFSDLDDDLTAADTTLSWYDSRKGVSTRAAEYRLYYQKNPVTDLMSKGDFFVFLKTKLGEYAVIISKAGSTSENQIKLLFNIPGEIKERANLRILSDDRKQRLDFVRATILESIGIQPDITDPSYLDTILKTFNGKWPDTKSFSLFSRKTLSDLDPIGKPDETLIKCYEQETILFKTLEKHFTGTKVSEGFVDVEDFISYSLTVQNRRKSRSGHALENHLEYLFQENEIKYSCREITERKSRPDFIFPGIKEYHDKSFNESLLVMLGVKTTCKERWRQILPEADRIDTKHLCTLEPAISKDQTDEMKSKKVILVIPEPIRFTYQLDQQHDVLNVARFIELIHGKQNR